MSLDNIINSYGYAFILLGTFLEGETVLILGGVAAKMGFLKLQWVVGTAFIGTVCGDQLFYYLGRYFGARLLAKKPKWQAKTERVRQVFNRYHIAVLLGFRFVYGLRSVTPFALGSGKLVSPLRFLFFDTVGAVLWSVSIGSAAYAFGSAVELILGDLQHYQLSVMLFIAVASFFAWLWHRYRAKQKSRNPVPPA